MLSAVPDAKPKGNPTLSSFTPNDPGEMVVADLHETIRYKRGLGHAKQTLNVIDDVLAETPNDENIHVEEGSALHEAINALAVNSTLRDSISFDASCTQDIDRAALSRFSTMIAALISTTHASQFIDTVDELGFTLRPVGVAPRSGHVVINMTLEFA